MYSTSGPAGRSALVGAIRNEDNDWLLVLWEVAMTWLCGVDIPLGRLLHDLYSSALDGRRWKSLKVLRDRCT